MSDTATPCSFDQVRKALTRLDACSIFVLVELSDQDKRYLERAVGGITDAILQCDIEIDNKPAGYFNPALAVDAFAVALAGTLYQAPEFRQLKTRRLFADGVAKSLLKALKELDRASVVSPEGDEFLDSASKIMRH